MLNRYIFILVALFVIVGCRKEEIKPLSKYSYIEGRYSGIGKMILKQYVTDARYEIYAPDAFDTFNVKYYNDSFIAVDGVTLKLDSASPNILIYYTSHWYYQYNTGYSMKVTYDINKKHLEYRSSESDAYTYRWYMVNTDKYLPNPLVGQYVASIQGVRNLSGFGHDTFASRNIVYSNDWEDSTYAISKAIDFFRVNDSTISFHGNPLDFSDSLMHYKLTDYAANTVIFQTYHTIRYEVSTLRYNYATNKITFEQHNFDDHRNRYLKIEQ
jgi:hypothetical protein